MRGLKGKPAVHATCAVCDDEILQVGRKWMHCDLTSERDHEAKPRARGGS